MKKLLLFLSFIAVTATVQAQSDYDKSTDPENGHTVYKGQFTFEDLKANPGFGWLERGAADYRPDSATVVYLKKHLPDYELVVLMGTWCEDSHNLVPKLYKTMTAAGYPMDRYRLYGLDRGKEAKYIEHKLYRVDRVPTFILVRKHEEIGRITENVNKSIEKDLAKLIEADQERVR